MAKKKVESTQNKIILDSTPSSSFWLQGIVKTQKGYAAVEAEFNLDGELISYRALPSQTYKQFVAIEVLKMTGKNTP
jgi:hypothetical protein